MFGLIRSVIQGTVDLAGDLVIEGCGVVTTLATELVATPADAVFGSNPLSDTVRGVNEFAYGTTKSVVDTLVKPVATSVISAPIVKTQLACNVVGGLAEAALAHDPTDGLRRAGKASLNLAMMATTAGIVGHFAGPGSHAVPNDVASV